MTLKANIEATMFRKEKDLFMHFLHESFLSVRIERHDISSVEKERVYVQEVQFGIPL